MHDNLKNSSAANKCYRLPSNNPFSVFETRGLKVLISLAMDYVDKRRAMDK